MFFIYFTISRLHLVVQFSNQFHFWKLVYFFSNWFYFFQLGDFIFNYFSTFFFWGGGWGGCFSKRITHTTSPIPISIPNPNLPNPNPISRPNPSCFFLFCTHLDLNNRPLTLKSIFIPLCHTSNRCKFAHICWSNKLLVPDSPFPFDTN